MLAPGVGVEDAHGRRLQGADLGLQSRPLRRGDLRRPVDGVDFRVVGEDFAGEARVLVTLDLLRGGEEAAEGEQHLGRAAQQFLGVLVLHLGEALELAGLQVALEGRTVDVGKQGNADAQAARE
ncbi:hypothetical protein D9M71_800950 [compost metagenome]